MKVLIEGGSVFRQRSGVGQYTKRLLEAMLKLDSRQHYTLVAFFFWLRTLPAPVFPGNPSVKYHFIRFFPGRIYNFLFKRGLAPPIDLLSGHRFDVVWFPNFVRWPVWSRRTKTIVTIYDLSFIEHSEYTSPRNLSYMRKFVPASLKKADRIVTISEYSKQQIVDFYKIDPAKVSIVYPAVDHQEYRQRTSVEISKVVKKYKLPTSYLLFVGTLEPRKNIAGLLDAYAGLPAELKQKYGLVLAGGKGWLDESLLAKIRSCQQAGDTILKLGYVPDEDLPVLYSGASLMVYPSSYEGFGMPPLEAMACGVPVITSDNSSLPEVVGQAGLMVKATDTKAMSDSMVKVLNNPKIANAMRQAGLIQSKKFSWQDSAKRMLAVIEES